MNKNKNRNLMHTYEERERERILFRGLDVRISKEYKVTYKSVQRNKANRVSITKGKYNEDSSNKEYQ